MNTDIRTSMNDQTKERGLSADVAGSTDEGLRSEAAKVLGQSKSEKKSRASRENGRKGGRPQQLEIDGLKLWIIETNKGTKRSWKKTQAGLTKLATDKGLTVFSIRAGTDKDSMDEEALARKFTK